MSNSHTPVVSKAVAAPSRLEFGWHAECRFTAKDLPMNRSLRPTAPTAIRCIQPAFALALAAGCGGMGTTPRPDPEQCLTKRGRRAVEVYRLAPEVDGRWFAGAR